MIMSKTCSFLLQKAIRLRILFDVIETEETETEGEKHLYNFDSLTLLDIDFAEKDCQTEHLHKDFPELNYGKIGRFGFTLKPEFI